MIATRIKEAVVLTGQYTLDGKMVLETECADYDDYRSLPMAVIFEGITCTKTGWSSDTHRACYQQGGGKVAYAAQ